MEKIYTLNTIKSLVRAYWVPALFLLTAITLLVVVRLHAESFHFGVYNDDEYHTIHQGLGLITDGRVDNFRTQESTRWLVRAFYPYALMYMNTHMGGNVAIDGWSYPSHNYVVTNFVHQKDVPATFSADPNLRDLFHALRVQYIAFVFVCVLSLFLFFFWKKYYIVAFGGVLLLGLNVDLLTEQKIFYVEPAMLASFALLILLYCRSLYREQISYPTSILFGFLAAFMISTKFSALFFVLLPAVLFFYLYHRTRALRLLAIYLIALVISYLLINIPAFTSLSSFNQFLHDLFSNFWQYGAGSDEGITVEPGLPYIGLLLAQLEGLLGYALYVLPLLSLFALWYAHAKERMILVPLIVLVSISAYSLSAQHVYLVRNLIPFYVPIVIIALLSIEIVARHIAEVRGFRYTLRGLVILSILCIGGVVVHVGGVSAFTSTLLPNTKTGFISEVSSLDPIKTTGPRYAIDFPDHFFQGTDVEKQVTTLKGAPTILSSKNYSNLLSEFSSLPKGSVVMVRNIGNNKHITHYILPKYFSENIQVGNYYVFFDQRAQ